MSKKNMPALGFPSASKRAAPEASSCSTLALSSSDPSRRPAVVAPSPQGCSSSPGRLSALQGGQAGGAGSAGRAGREELGGNLRIEVDERQGGNQGEGRRPQPRSASKTRHALSLWSVD